MSEWRVCKLSEVAIKFAMGPFGSNIKAETFTNHGIPVIRGTNLNFYKYVGGEFVYLTEEKANQLKSSNCFPDDIVITHRGTLGQVGMIPKGKYERYVISQSGMKVTVNPELLYSHFLLYFFKSSQGQYQLLQHESQVGVPSISNPLTSLKSVSLHLPPLPEQKAISSVLSSLDDKIDLLHRQNKTLEAMAETLFKQWFVVEAREDWDNVPFSKWIENTFGGEWGKEKSIAEFLIPVYCIRGTDIADLQTGLATKTPVRFIKKKKFEIIEPKNGDIIIEISGGTENQSTGRALYINEQVKLFYDLPLVFSNFCRLIRPRKSEYSFFIYSYIQYLYNQDEFFNLENGSSGIKNLNYKVLLFELAYPMPTEENILEFNNKVSIYFFKINKNKKQIQTLEKLRDNLLPKLMSGEVRVAL